MICEHVTLPDGTHVHLCRGGRRPLCSVKPCTNRADLLCDFPKPGGTCDRRICNEHAKEVGPDKHMCPEHAAGAATQENLL